MTKICSKLARVNDILSISKTRKIKKEEELR